MNLQIKNLLIFKKNTHKDGFKILLMVFFILLILLLTSCTEGTDTEDSFDDPSVIESVDYEGEEITIGTLRVISVDDDDEIIEGQEPIEETTVDVVSSLIYSNPLSALETYGQDNTNLQLWEEIKAIEKENDILILTTQRDLPVVVELENWGNTDCFSELTPGDVLYMKTSELTEMDSLSKLFGVDYGFDYFCELNSFQVLDHIDRSDEYMDY